ncbi:phosphatase PAP2 family protein [Kribbella swartbergensis]
MSRADDEPARTEVRPAVVAAVRRSAVPLMALGLVLIAVPALVYSGATRAGRLDRWMQSVVDHTPPGAYDATLAVDWLGEPVGRAVLVLATAALCLVLGRRALAMTAVAASILVGVLTTGLKPLVDRRIHEGFLSYPSGHTAALAAVGVVLGLLLVDLLHAGPILGTAIVLVAGLIGGALMAWAQIALMAHYPTDTVGGVGCALLVVPATGLLIDRLR